METGSRVNSRDGFLLRASARLILCGQRPKPARPQLAARYKIHAFGKPDPPMRATDEAIRQLKICMEFDK